MHRVVCLLVFVSGALGQEYLVGQCNTAAERGYIENVNINLMLGSWYQIARKNNELEIGECSTLTLKGIYNSSGALARVEATYATVINGTKTFYNGTMRREDDDEFVALDLPGFLIGLFVFQATDYINFAFFYSFNAINYVKPTEYSEWDYVWQFHRRPTLTTSESDCIKKVMNYNRDLSVMPYWNVKTVKHDDESCGRNAGASATTLA